VYYYFRGKIQQQQTCVLRKSKIPMVCVAISPSKHVSYKRHQTWYVKPFHLRHQTRVHYQYHQIIMVRGAISPPKPDTCPLRTPPDHRGTWSHFTFNTRHVCIMNTSRSSWYVEAFHLQNQTCILRTPPDQGTWSYSLSTPNTCVSRTPLDYHATWTKTQAH
jgi:hypothetical protein